MRVYIAGPYTGGDPVLNVRAAVEAAAAVADAGHVPYVPHLSHLWHLIAPRPYEDWMRMDLEWLKCCDCMIRLPGESKGADIEMVLAARYGLPIYFSLNMWRGGLWPAPAPIVQS